MTDFFITDDSLNDHTAEILEAKGYSFLLISPHLESASENNLDLIDDVYDYCEHWGYTMNGLTSSGADAIKKWTEDTGAEYRFLNCDEIPLQTIVRSNPGLVFEEHEFDSEGLFSTGRNFIVRRTAGVNK